MLLRTALLGIALAVPASAQGNSADADGTPGPGFDVERATRESDRLLTLASGQVLRARSRWSDDHWEIRQGSAWTGLPADAVVRARLEREALKEWRARRANVEGAESVPGRLENARWAAAQGLYDEALETLDQVLDRDPDSEDVLAWLRTDPIPLRTETGGELVDAAARMRPAAREILWSRTDTAEPRLRDELVGALTDGASPRRRTAAAHGLRRLFPGEALRELSSRAVLDASEDVRREAARALRTAGTDRASAPLVRALTSDHPAVRRNAAEALGHTRYITAVQPLIARLAALQGSPGTQRPPASYLFTGRQIAYLQDFDVEVANNASIGDPQVGVLSEGSVLDVRVLGISRTTVHAERAAIRRSLEMLTNIRAGNTTRAWLDWWQRNGEDWFSQSARERPPSPETGSADG